MSDLGLTPQVRLRIRAVQKAVDGTGMKTMSCPSCGKRMKRNGTTSAGRQRWRCTACGASTVNRYKRDADAEQLSLFLGWLLSKRTQGEMGLPARTFRAATSRFWKIWPVSPACDEIHHVVHVDGIWIKRRCVVLIALSGDGNVIGWHLARSESSAAWAALMSRIAPPDVVVTDGGGGIEGARRAQWPSTRVQRCTFHAFEQVKRCTTTRPRTQAVFGNGFLDTLAARFRQSGKRTADVSDFCLPEHQGLVHPLARAVELDESSMVDHPVDHRGGKLVVAQDRSPFAELDVGGEHHASLLVAC